MMTDDTVVPIRTAISSTVGLRETYFGVILTEIDSEPFGSVCMRGVLRALATVCVGFAVSVWILPGSVQGADLLSLKIGLFGLLSSLGILLTWAARDGVRPEVQFDTTRREIRFAERVGRGKARLSAAIAMDHVVNVTVDPVLPDSEHAVLRLRLDGIDEALHLASGLQSDLLPVAARLRRDLRRPSQRMEDRLRLRPVSRAA